MATAEQRGWNNSGTGRRPATWDRPKLTAEQRLQIRQRLTGGETARVLAAEFGVSRQTIEYYR